MNSSNGGEGGQGKVNSWWFDNSVTPWLHTSACGSLPKTKIESVREKNQCLSPKSRGSNKERAVSPTKQGCLQVFEKERNHCEGQDRIYKTKGTFLKRVEEM